MKKNVLLLGMTAIWLAVMCSCGNKNKPEQIEEFAQDEYSLTADKLQNGYLIPQSEVTIFKQDGLFGVRNAKGDTILAAEYVEVVCYGESNHDNAEFLFWRQVRTSGNGLAPDAEVICDHFNLIVRKDTVMGLYSKQGMELLPVKYLDIAPMNAAKSYAVSLDNARVSIWKDGRFIVSGSENGFYGTDLEKQRYVFSSRNGKRWDFYDFDGKTLERLDLKSAPQGYCLPQVLGPGRFLVDHFIVNSRGNKLVELPEWTEVCGNFLSAPAQDGSGLFDIFFNNGKKLFSGADKVYPVASAEVPHLPTGDIVVEKDGKFKLFGKNGKYLQDAEGVVLTWVFGDVRAEDLVNKVPFFAGYN